jgi:DNA (cytosine-5)-methyltransferase 1
MTLTLIDFFCGAGGSSQGAVAVPGVSVRLAANHWRRAVESHALNFPSTEHFCGDLHDAEVEKLPAGDIFWASPECTHWSMARGHRREFDRQPDLFGETLPAAAADRSRSLMWDVPRYLAAMRLRGRPVLAGVVENVIEARAGAQWGQWVTAIGNLGYRTRLIALNSMHARPRVTPYAPQSRDRLYLAYWAASLGRDPDWDRWLRPQAWCPGCEEQVTAVQWWKRPGNDMGRYRQQYLYRCPRVSCRGQIVVPGAMPAAVAIDWSIPGTRIGDRVVPLKPKTLARIEAGLKRYAQPITLQTGGADRYAGSRVRPVDEPHTTQTAGPTKALAAPPLLVPAGGTWRDGATPVAEPMPARTARENDGLAVPPFITVHRGAANDIRTREVTQAVPAISAGGNHLGVAVPPFLVPLRSGRNRSIRAAEPLATVVADGGNHGLVTPPMLTTPPFIATLRGNCGTQPVTDPLGTISTSGSHHALIMRNNGSRGHGSEHCTPVTEPLRTLTAAGHQSLLTWEHLAHLLVPYYGTGVAHPLSEPAGTVTALDRHGLASPATAVEDVLFRMLEPHEIGAAMAFASGYQVMGNKREKVRQYGNAVTPPVAEVLISALVEAISGEELERAA